MKISIGTNIKEGPWGGGNLFAINLKNFLIKNGHQVVHNLDDDDVDLILITEPRKTSESSAFTHLDVKNYINFVKEDAIVVHRINECDERKNTNFVNKYMIEANKISDYTVFVSSWLKDLYTNQGMDHENKIVILAGADKKIFNSKEKSKWNSIEPLNLVTHHWGANINKGFDVYKKLDQLIGNETWNKKINFTYIGNLPKNFNFKNAIHLNPLSGNELASEIKKNHVYITGSLNEPSGNHHIEGAQCGLPIMYINSGGIDEYCKGFGVDYDIDNLERKVNYVLQNYTTLESNMTNYPHDAEKMCNDFLNLFENLIEKKSDVLSKRQIPKPSRFESKLYKYKKQVFDFIKKQN